MGRMTEWQLRLALAVSVAVSIALALRLVAWRLRLQARVEAEITAWRERELARVERQLAAAADAQARARFETWRAESEGRIRRDAASRSRGVITGQVAEHLAPYLDGFPYNPKDVRFLGSPVDLVVFDGLDAGRLRRVVFVEVKTGGSALTARERAVRDVLRDGQVDWEEFRPALMRAGS
jgi:predicted Holliday junction resolvase-like endonuclease